VVSGTRSPDHLPGRVNPQLQPREACCAGCGRGIGADAMDFVACRGAEAAAPRGLRGFL